MKLFYSLYSLLLAFVSKTPLLLWLGVHPSRVRAFREEAFRSGSAANHGLQTAWFHAASTGELEMLMPLIEEYHQKGIPLGVSVFSESAISFLKKLPAGLMYAGFSPRDDHWQELFAHFNVSRVIVSKYEAWPGLWAACSESHIRLVLINAQARRSLRWVRRFLKLFGVPQPRVAFFSVDQANAKALASQFPSAQVEVSLDPRWLRAGARAKQASAHPRVELWKQYAAEHHMQRPYVMAGSAWLSDLEKIVPPFRHRFDQTHEGTLWVIPHSLTEENVKRIEAYLQRQIPGKFVLVCEMGVLVELYSIADRIFVGGGFEKGIHSTLEAGVYSVPIACGPRNAHHFFETRELQKSGRLKICGESDDVARWLRPKDQPELGHSIEEMQKVMQDKTAQFNRLVEQSLQLR